MIENVPTKIDAWTNNKPPQQSIIAAASIA
jgi:hypothetical protein